MTRITKWSIPVLAMSMMVALTSGRAAGAEDAKDANAEKMKISGTVQLDDGQPAASAKVRLMAMMPKKDKGDKDKGEKDKAEKVEAKSDAAVAQAADDQKEAAKADGEKVKGSKGAKAEAIAETTADADGKFELEAPAGRYTLIANLKGSGSARKTITVKSESLDNLELKLKPSKSKDQAAPATPAQ